MGVRSPCRSAPLVAHVKSLDEATPSRRCQSHVRDTLSLCQVAGTWAPSVEARVCVRPAPAHLSRAGQVPQHKGLRGRVLVRHAVLPRAHAGHWSGLPFGCRSEPTCGAAAASRRGLPRRESLTRAGAARPRNLLASPVRWRQSAPRRFQCPRAQVGRASRSLPACAEGRPRPAAAGAGEAGGGAPNVPARRSWPANRARRRPHCATPARASNRPGSSARA